MLSCQQLQCQRGERELFRDIEFALARGELLRVEGPNGSGKTSLLRIVAGLSQPVQGEVRWNDENIADLAEDYFREVLFLGHSAAVKDELSVLENLTLTLELCGEVATHSETMQALTDAGLKERLHLPARYLSQGQRRRVALARLRLSKRPLWILDEPFTALDAAAVTMLAQWIADHVSRGGMVMFTTHQDVAIPGFRPKSLTLAS